MTDHNAHRNTRPSDDLGTGHGTSLWDVPHTCTTHRAEVHTKVGGTHIGHHTHHTCSSRTRACTSWLLLARPHRHTARTRSRTVLRVFIGAPYVPAGAFALFPLCDLFLLVFSPILKRSLASHRCRNSSL